MKKHTEEHRQRISAALKGREVWNKGKAWSSEMKEKISQATRGRTAWNKGKPWSAEVKDKISKSKKESKQNENM